VTGVQTCALPILAEDVAAKHNFKLQQIGIKNIQIPSDDKEILKIADDVSIPAYKEIYGEDLTALMWLLTYGLKGTAAYAHHAEVLGIEDKSIYAFFAKALHHLASKEPSIETTLNLCLECGEINLKVMEMLDRANTSTYGNPVPTKVRITPVKGKAIVVSGHDLKDLEELLKQTEGKGINIYTHGEMLPAHGYPKLKQYKHFVGNYGGAWQDQQKEFDIFPGAILMTTNCIQKPKPSYIDRIFTCGLVQFPGVKHIKGRDFSNLIEAALKTPGFTADEPEKYITVGFAHNAILQVAQKVIEAVKQGKIRHFFLIGGCDGAKSGRNYYTDLAKKIPQNCIILTLACGKYRFNKLDFGDVEGIPRLLDCGQCNDAYSAIQVAIALSKAFGVSVNELPLSLVLSWYEQKAVCILLTLLHLGIKNIRLGPSLPAFITPNILKVLVEKFNIQPITTPEQDLNAIL
jgi:hydroxylamine reductase